MSKRKSACCSSEPASLRYDGAARCRCGARPLSLASSCARASDVSRISSVASCSVLRSRSGRWSNATADALGDLDRSRRGRRPRRVRSRARYLAHVQPSPSAPTRFATGTRTFDERDRVDFGIAVGRRRSGCTVMPGACPCRRAENEIPACGFTVASVRARKEHPRRVLRERDPDFLAVHDVVIAVANRRRAQRGEIGAGVRLREALTPPVISRKNPRQIPSPSVLPCRMRSAPGRA